MNIYSLSSYFLSKHGPHPACLVSRLIDHGVSYQTTLTALQLFPYLQYIRVLRFGLPGGIRTPDPRLRRPLFYPAELRADSFTIVALNSLRVFGVLRQ